jgi:hypothetical protein
MFAGRLQGSNAQANPVSTSDDILQKLVERAERDARIQPTSEYLEGLGYIEVDDVWYGPDTYMQPFIEEVLPLAREIDEAAQKGDTTAFERLAARQTDLQARAVQRLLRDLGIGPSTYTLERGGVDLLSVNTRRPNPAHGRCVRPRG